MDSPPIGDWQVHIGGLGGHVTQRQVAHKVLSTERQTSILVRLTKTFRCPCYLQGKQISTFHDYKLICTCTYVRISGWRRVKFGDLASTFMMAKLKHFLLAYYYSIMHTMLYGIAQT
jgi:hypothetical protein